MLETVDFSEEPLPKEEYKARRDALTERLVVLQQEARAAGVGLVVLFEGWNGAGKGSRISDLMYNLDARATSVYVTENFNAVDAASFPGAEHGVGGFYPMMQQFWKALGGRGTITFYDRGWYTSAVQRMLYTQFGEVKIKNGKVLHPRATVARAVREAAEERHIDALRGALASSADFEKQLTDDGYVVVKFFVHVTKEAQRKRLTRLRRDPATAWRVSDGKMATIGEYEEAYRLYDNLLEGSDFSYAPWHLINGEDKRRANLKITETLVDALDKALHAKKDPAALAAAAKAQANSAGAAEEVPLEGRSPEQQLAVAQAAAEQAAAQAAHAPRASRFRIVDRVPSLDQVDHGLVLDHEEYKDRLKKQQKRLNKLEMEMYQARVPLMLMFEGWDAAGKGGAIKRVAQALDARAYTIFPSPGAHQARACPPSPVALLDAPSQGGARGHLRPQLVRPRAGGARGGLRHRRPVGSRLRRDQRVRAGAGALGRRAAEVLGGCQPGRAAGPLPRPSGRPCQAVEDHRRGLAQPRQVSAVQKRRRGHVPLDVHAVRAVDRAGVRR